MLPTLFGVLVLSVLQDATVYYDGVEKKVRFPPIIKSGRALVHVRETFHSLGAVVKHHQNGGKIEAWRGDTYIVLEAGKKTALLNGKKVVLDQAPIIHKYPTEAGLIIPIRFVSEALKAKVTYSPEGSRVDIDTTAMGFFSETPPFKAGDKVMLLIAGRYQYVPAKVIAVRDWPNDEDSYTVEYKDKTGRVLRPTVGRRYIKKA